MIRFEVYDHGSEFQHGEDYDLVVKALDEALEQRNSGRITWAKYLKVLKTLAADHPDFIDGHALIQSSSPYLVATYSDERSALVKMAAVEISSV